MIETIKLPLGCGWCLKKYGFVIRIEKDTIVQAGRIISELQGDTTFMHEILVIDSRALLILHTDSDKTVSDIEKFAKVREL
jgi:hypothetical protein